MVAKKIVQASEKGGNISYDIVRVEIQLFKAGLRIYGKRQIERFLSSELWFPANHVRFTLDPVNSAMEVVHDCAFLSFSPIGSAPDGVTNGNIDFMLSTLSAQNVFDVDDIRKFIKEAKRLQGVSDVEKAEFKKQHPELDFPDENNWSCHVLMTVFETSDDDPAEKPRLRGLLPMDERLLTITTSL